MKNKQKEDKKVSVAPTIKSNKVVTGDIRNNVTITSDSEWYIRLWYAITNIFTYIFNGYIRL
jgi:hypothetical protein